ncbi:MAG: site-specific integrase [Clostridia bacterium]|nr:site-specific integrase [Clostridia bacterium]
MRKIDNELIEKYKNYLIDEERSQATVEKYVRDICFFSEWLSGREVNKRLVLEYKEKVMEGHAPRSVNSVISSLNSLFDYLGWHDCRVKTLKIQKQIFADRDRELTETEYDRLLSAAKSKKNERLYFLMQTICSTGIRVSEDIYCKG